MVLSLKEQESLRTESYAILNEILTKGKSTSKVVSKRTLDGREILINLELSISGRNPDNIIPKIISNTSVTVPTTFNLRERMKIKSQELKVSIPENTQSLNSAEKSVTQVFRDSKVKQAPVVLRKITLERADPLEKTHEDSAMQAEVKQSNWYPGILVLLLGVLLLFSQPYWFPFISSQTPSLKQTVDFALQGMKEETETVKTINLVTPTTDTIIIATPSPTAIVTQKYTPEKLREEMHLPSEAQVTEVPGELPGVSKHLLLTYQGQVVAPKSDITEVFLLVQRGSVKELVPARSQPITPRGANETIEIFVMNKKAQNNEEVHLLQDNLVNAIKPQSRHEIKIERRLL